MGLSGVGDLVADHPRSRGEHVSGDGFGFQSEGSSPLTRGALSFVKHVDGIFGIIPAHAGSTIVSRWCRVPSRDHPRSRGEHEVLITHTGGVVGSSPLTRGAPHYPFYTRFEWGIIPAHAGSTVRM